jgi:tetratricopeptide (TPR) repeat protein
MRAPLTQRCSARRVLLALWLGALLPLAGADDPYALWSAGRPAAAIPALYAAAQASGRWDAWLDLGLAAAAAQDRPRAAAWLAEAARRAPERREPREALRALDPAHSIALSWSERLGPLAWPGTGWPAVVLLGGAGLALGLALAGRRRRASAAFLGCVALAAAAPGQLAGLRDARHELLAVARDSHLLDSAGNPGDALPAGTLAERELQQPWPERVFVRLADGRRGYLALVDTQAGPAAP